MTKTCMKCRTSIREDESHVQIQALHCDRASHYTTDDGELFRKRPLEDQPIKPIASTGTLNFCTGCFRAYYRELYSQMQYLWVPKND